MDILGCPWTLLAGGPARHRINAENAYFYRANANSRIAVTPKITPTTLGPLSVANQFEP
jgi:hypothetical protein